MKLVILFVLSFVIISALPFLWNQFTFVEAGFPFPFVKISTIESEEYAQTVYLYDKLFMLYDLVLLAVVIWMISSVRKSWKKV